MFAYCGNNPVVRSDEEGTFFFTVLGAVIGSAVGAAVVGGTMNVLSLGTAPINGEIVKGTLSQMVDNIFFECSYKIGSLIENTLIGTMIAETGTLLTRAVTST